MDIKAVQVSRLGNIVDVEKASSSSASRREKPSSDSISHDEPKMSLSAKASSKMAQMHSRNELISLRNITSEGVSNISKALEGIESALGNIDGKSQEELEEVERTVALLSEKIVAAQFTSMPDGLRPLAGDEIAIAVEKEVGQTLNIVFPPDPTPEPVRIGTVSFSPPEALRESLFNIKVAKEKFSVLQNAVKDTTTLINNTLTEIDIAAENVRSAEAQIRDVDQAALTADSMQERIMSNPGPAIQSIKDTVRAQTSVLDS